MGTSHQDVKRTPGSKEALIASAEASYASFVIAEAPRSGTLKTELLGVEVIHSELAKSSLVVLKIHALGMEREPWNDSYAAFILVHMDENPVEVLDSLGFHLIPSLEGIEKLLEYLRKNAEADNMFVSGFEAGNC